MIHILFKEPWMGHLKFQESSTLGCGHLVFLSDLSLEMLNELVV